MKKLYVILTLLFVSLQAASLVAGSMIWGWNLINPAGGIYDLKFLPGENQFILTAGTEIQIRDCQTGQLIKTYPNKNFTNFEFTPDSTRIVTIGNYGRYLQMRNLQDMSIIKQDSLILDKDTLPKSFESILIDPIKPYIYAVIIKQGIIGTQRIDTRELIRYNYETLTQIDTIAHFGGLTAISKDGKYLAVLNGGESHIKVFSLETMNFIKDFKLCEDYSSQSAPSGIVTCIKFSEINTDNIFYSSKFPQYKNDGSHRGLFTYNIQSNKIIDSTFGVGPKRLLEGYFVLFDNEVRIMNNGTGPLTVVNFLTKNDELQLNVQAGDPGAWIKIINKNNLFLGFAGEYFSMGQYDSKVGIGDKPKDIQTLYPNPTDNIVNVKTNCLSNDQRYEIYTIDGALLNSTHLTLSGQSFIIIDFSKYINGIYNLKIYCGKNITSYKIIKEG